MTDDRVTSISKPPSHWNSCNSCHSCCHDYCCSCCSFWPHLAGSAVSPLSQSHHSPCCCLGFNWRGVGEVILSLNIQDAPPAVVFRLKKPQTSTITKMACKASGTHFVHELNIQRRRTERRPEKTWRTAVLDPTNREDGCDRREAKSVAVLPGQLGLPILLPKAIPTDANEALLD